MSVPSTRPGPASRKACDLRQARSRGHDACGAADRAGPHPHLDVRRHPSAAIALAHFVGSRRCRTHQIGRLRSARGCASVSSITPRDMSGCALSTRPYASAPRYDQLRPRSSKASPPAPTAAATREDSPSSSMQASGCFNRFRDVLDRDQPSGRLTRGIHHRELLDADSSAGRGRRCLERWCRPVRIDPASRASSRPATRRSMLSFEPQIAGWGGYRSVAHSR
jgi:hypothetical protein